MYVSYSALVVCVIIIVISLSMFHKMGYDEGKEEFYDMGYEACRKEFNVDKKIKYEFEEFLYEKGYVIDKSLGNIKILKSIKNKCK